MRTPLSKVRAVEAPLTIPTQKRRRHGSTCLPPSSVSARTASRLSATNAATSIGLEAIIERRTAEPRSHPRRTQEVPLAQHELVIARSRDASTHDRRRPMPQLRTRVPQRARHPDRAPRTATAPTGLGSPACAEPRPVLPVMQRHKERQGIRHLARRTSRKRDSVTSTTARSKLRPFRRPAVPVQLTLEDMLSG